MRRVSPIVLAAALAAFPVSAAPMEQRKDWPCPGCFAAVPAPGAPAGPRPLLVALHGDFNGDPSAPAKLFRALRPASEEAGVILVALRCPEEKGCRSGSFWKWMLSGEHDAAWLGAQIDLVSSSFSVDAPRVYATGYSGGATYLGWYGPTHAERFAAIAHLAGGAPWGTPCPRCKVPVLFTLGAGDPMLVPYTRPLREYYEGCGEHEIIWETLPNVSHEGLLGVVQGGKGTAVLSWLLRHQARCGDERAIVDAGSAPEALDAGRSGSDEARVDAGESAPTHTVTNAPLPSRMAPGCACDLRGGEGQSRETMIALLAAVLALVTRSNRRP